ncbi:high mobility group box domain-containing protein, partial [Pisolithus croceorrhizus]
ADIQAALLHDFISPPVFDVPLVPHEYQWPSLDSPVMYPTSSTSTSPSSSTQSSPSPAVGVDSLPDIYDHSSAFPSSAELASMPIPPSRGTSRNKSPNHIPRPRNAFMLFRSAFAAAQKIRTTVEHDNRHITRIIAHCWNRLSDADKRVWREKAAAEKALHAIKYPNYRFSPVGRATKPIKRNVRRNGIEDKMRCEKVADLLLAGKSGEELEDAVKQIDMSLKAEVSNQARNDASLDVEESSANDRDWQSQFSDSEDSNIPPFRSPLLPPTEPAI